MRNYTLKLMRCIQNQKASQAQSNSKQEEISTQVLKLKLFLCWQLLKSSHLLHTRKVASVVETVRELDLELRNEMDKNEIDKRQISASFLEVG